MPSYKIHLRSFAPWKEFGAVTPRTAIALPAMPRLPFSLPGFGSAPTLQFGGAFHGDGRGFSLEAASAAVTSRVNYWVQVNLDTATASNSRAWCDETRGPAAAVGPQDRGTAVARAKTKVYREGTGVTVKVEYAASNPIVPGAPDVDVAAEYFLSLSGGQLNLDTTITGDQFPACESFIEDPRGSKIFVGGFSPQNKEQMMRLLGGMNKPDEVWYSSSVAIAVDAIGNFITVIGGGAGNQSSGAATSSHKMSLPQWNTRVMGSIAMPADA